MFAALDDPKRAPVYWLFAAVYAAPALHYGLGFDALSAVSLAACFAHVQIEKAAQKEAVRLPLIVNGDIVDGASAREALAQSGADAVMIGRGIYGRPWAAAMIAKALAGEAGVAADEPGPQARLAIALDHFREALAFYGDRLGVKIFRKHLGWYVEKAPWPASPLARRAAKAALCRLESPAEIEAGLAALWLQTGAEIAISA